MYNTIQRTNNPNFCANVSFINRINKDAKKLATIIEERTKDFPNSKIEINGAPDGRLMSVLIDDSKHFVFDPFSTLWFNSRDEESVAGSILRLFNIHIYEENVKKFFEKFCTEINGEATNLDLNVGCGNTIFNLYGKEPMTELLKEHIDHVRDVNLRCYDEYKGMHYEDLSYTAK